MHGLHESRSCRWGAGRGDRATAAPRGTRARTCASTPLPASITSLLVSMLRNGCSAPAGGRRGGANRSQRRVSARLRGNRAPSGSVRPTAHAGVLHTETPSRPSFTWLPALTAVTQACLGQCLLVLLKPFLGVSILLFFSRQILYCRKEALRLALIPAGRHARVLLMFSDYFILSLFVLSFAGASAAPCALALAPVRGGASAACAGHAILILPPGECQDRRARPPGGRCAWATCARRARVVPAPRVCARCSGRARRRVTRVCKQASCRFRRGSCV